MSKVLLAFSGGLDTSYCARYLSVDMGFEVHTVIVNTGGFSEKELADIAERAHSCQVWSHAEIDRKDELYRDVLRYCIAGNVIKNASYPLSVSAERVIQAIAIAEHALEIGATHIAHGSTGAGNDQIRFDVIFQALCPHLPVITPIRDQSLTREEEIDYVTEHGLEGDWSSSEYSVNQGLWGTTIGGKETLTSGSPLPDHAWPSAAESPDGVTDERLIISFEGGEPTALNGKKMGPVELIEELNVIGKKHHIGRGMHVGDTILGIKGRVAFEAPAAVLLIEAHRTLEKHTLTKWQINLKDQLSMWYGQLLHEGKYLERAMRSIEAFFRDTQQMVTGDVDVMLRDEMFDIHGVNSENDLFKSKFATYGEVNHSWTARDARGYALIESISTQVSRGDKK